jgi:hypothetical protein
LQQPSEDGTLSFNEGIDSMNESTITLYMAIRNRDIELRRLARRGIARNVTPWLYTFELDEGKLDILNVKRFVRADKE